MDEFEAIVCDPLRVEKSRSTDRRVAFGYGDDGRIVSGGFRAQGEQAFSNLRRALEAGGASLKSVVKVSIFVTDMGNFQEVVELRRKFFSAPYPADTIVEIKALYTPEAMIEIEAVAAVVSEREG